MPHPKSPEPTTPPPATRRTRGDRGLTTLEWLLIVAAVAGLAALAVVLVQNVVDDTAEQISGSSARLTAANVAAAEITADTEAAITEAKGKTDEADQITVANREGKAKCDRLEITYGDALDEGDQETKWTDMTQGSSTPGCEID